mmetsp:Transcript_65287/g.173121  ORF Transcript_65287/g.173121 Transcript_65287/m.173121 type:complete len:409 (-) Transcript_65287:28-1254(-)
MASGGSRALEAAWASALSDERFADVTCLVRERSFKLSRLPLAIASPVLASKLYTCVDDAPVNLFYVECSPTAFEEVARFAYRLAPRLNSWNVFHVRQVAVDLQIHSLVGACDRFVSQVQEDLADGLLGLLDTAMELRCGYLEKVVGHVVARGATLLRSDELLKVRSETMEFLLDRLEGVLADDWWHTCRNWAGHQETVHGGEWQQYLKPLCKYIKFSSLSASVFETAVVRTGILSSEQEVDVLLQTRRSPEKDPAPTVIDIKEEACDASVPVKEEMAQSVETAMPAKRRCLPRPCQNIVREPPPHDGLDSVVGPTPLRSMCKQEKFGDCRKLPCEGFAGVVGQRKRARMPMRGSVSRATFGHAAVAKRHHPERFVSETHESTEGSHAKVNRAFSWTTHRNVRPWRNVR